MRLSCMPDDTGYERYCALMVGNDLKFFLDGAKVDKVITADDEEGFLLVYVRDGNGKPIDRPDRTPITARVPGAVRIDIIPRSQTQETTCASHQRPAGPRFRSS